MTPSFDGSPRGYAAFQPFLKRGKCTLKDLLVMNDQNDPFYVGRPNQVKLAEWFADLWARYVTTPYAYLRRLHYQLISQHDPRKADGTPYLNTLHDWDLLSDASRFARYLGLVDPRRLEDHRNPEPHLPPAWETSGMLPAVEFTLGRPFWGLPSIATNLSARLDLAFPAPDVRGYDYSIADQRYHLELWIEKSTMNDVLLPLAARYNAVLVTSVGFQSITSEVQLLTQRVRAGRPTRVFYLSDFDPAGAHMPVSAARQVEWWLDEFAPGHDIKLIPIVLTRDQVVQYQLPRMPIRTTDTRKPAFEERYGTGAVELDALEALVPGALRQIVLDALEPYLDPTLRERTEDARAEAEADIAAQWRDETAPLRAHLRAIRDATTTIYGRYQAELTALREALDQELAPWQEALTMLAEEVADAQDAFDPVLPACPEAEEAYEEETPWLYSSDRSYWEQLAAYKAHKNGPGAEP